jgi:hypothetical protein
MMTIRDLRQEGRTDEAMELAMLELTNATKLLSEIDTSDSNLHSLLGQRENAVVWAKRNLSWVHYDYLKKFHVENKDEAFIKELENIKALQLGPLEVMFYNNVAFIIGQRIFKLSTNIPSSLSSIRSVFSLISEFAFERPSNALSFLAKALHKAFKKEDDYGKFASWFGLSNLQEADFQSEVLEGGREVMSLAEQIYIGYAKHLLPKRSNIGETIFDKEKAQAFLPKLIELCEKYPHYQYPPYFHAKFLLALGTRQESLMALIPFARKKKKDFWVWSILGEVFSNDREQVFNCYCKALSCRSPEEMLVALREKMVVLLIERNLLSQAKTEIELICKSRTNSGFPIPERIQSWKRLPWYENSNADSNNIRFYKPYAALAEELLYAECPINEAIIIGLNSEKQFASFVINDRTFGFFKYRSFFRELKIGDVLEVRIDDGTSESIYKFHTASLGDNPELRAKYYREVEGFIKIPPNKDFAFLDDIWISPPKLKSLGLTNGGTYRGKAVRSYDKTKNKWSWKLI